VNHLAGESSPYLLQHAGNPVDWYPWGEEAFALARREDKPVFLSIGYSTCHWCHVMERESFEDPDVAALMNRAFVSIKVDREERPDLDEHFMAVSQALTNSGGWPLTVVLTPDGKPFFAATYVPRESMYGRMGMLELVPRIGETWKARRAEVLASADSIAAEIGRAAAAPADGGRFDAGSIARAAEALVAQVDGENGGFGSAPKFPMATVYPLLLRAWKRTGSAAALAAVEKGLLAMRNGGVYDQVGFGFHRYSTDARWLVPHFEKMLYDQALLALAYTEAWQATGKDFYRCTAREILAYVLRDLRTPEGAFCSAEDADSEGEEGAFYLWTAEEIRGVLGGGAAEAFCRTYGVAERGNFAGARSANILHRKPDAETATGESESLLLAARGSRVRPFKDDKVLADWNGLAIAALARAGAAFEEPSFTAAAAEAAGFLLSSMDDPEGRLLHRFRAGQAAIPGFADDYAFLCWGLLELYAADFNPRWLDYAIRLADGLLERFWDPDGGGFFQAASDACDSRAARRKSLPDGVLPSANSVGLLVLARLAELTGKSEYRARAEQTAAVFPQQAEEASISFGAFLSGLDVLAGPSFEVVIAGDPSADDTRAMVRELRRRFLPRVTVLLRPAGAAGAAIGRIAPSTAAQVPVGGRATAHVCRSGACGLPTTDIAVMLRQLGE
jgi:uncharacterized protein